MQKMQDFSGRTNIVYTLCILANDEQGYTTSDQGQTLKMLKPQGIQYNIKVNGLIPPFWI